MVKCEKEKCILYKEKACQECKDYRRCLQLKYIFNKPKIYPSCWKCDLKEQDICLAE
jgi:hypothetical protein